MYLNGNWNRDLIKRRSHINKADYKDISKDTEGFVYLFQVKEFAFIKTSL